MNQYIKQMSQFIDSLEENTNLYTRSSGVEPKNFGCPLEVL